MAAHEQQPQQIVAVMRVVQPLHQRRLDIIQVRQLFFRRQRIVPGAPPHAVERCIATDHDQPRRRIARWTVARPMRQRAQGGFLERLLGGVEVAEIAQQRADGLGPGGRQCGLDPARIAHAAELCRWSPRYSAIGRIS